MVVRGRILAVFNSFPLFPSKARFAVVSRSFFGRLFTSDDPALDGYPLSGNLSSEQPEKCGDKKRNHDINVIINKVLNAQSESEVFQSLAQDIEALEYLGILEQSPYCKPDVQSFYPLLKLYFRDGKTCKCLNLVDDVVKKHHLCLDLATYTLLIHGFCRGNKYERAYQLFKEMIGQNIKPRYVTCSLPLKEMREKNMYGAAEMIEDVMKKMKSPGQKNCW
ncbi:hypothetical protein SASPL_115908 [Salvia splendens]|uniref:Uncharacterized protein n=1 Tax=Salvia splendens TaxID=180675 RepID=A0A8X8Y4M5_SALSN|nr:hypothetical protein SASPL_115908 [Salvia splendens]